MIRSTQPTPVSGRLHVSRIFFSPFLVTCSIVTIRRLAEATRSIAPPIPFTIAPGTIQLAMSPLRDLHRSEDGEIDLAAADHAEGVGAGEVRRAGDHGHGLLAGVD